MLFRLKGENNKMVKYPPPEAFLDADLSELVEIAIEVLAEAEELEDIDFE